TAAPPPSDQMRVRRQIPGPGRSRHAAGPGGCQLPGVPAAGMAPTGSGPAPAYQCRVEEPESRYTDPVASGRSNTDWTATRPGPCRSSHTVLACQRAELNQ